MLLSERRGIIISMSIDKSINLDDDVFMAKLEVSVKKNGNNLTAIGKDVDVHPITLTKWMNKDINGIKSKVRNWQLEAMLASAEATSGQILGYSAFKNDGSLDSGVLSVQQREASFLREKLLIARDTYDNKTSQIVNVIAPQPILANIFDNIIKIDAVQEVNNDDEL